MPAPVTNGFAHGPRSDVPDGAEVPDGNAVVASDAPSPGLRERGEGHHEDAEQHRPKSDHHPAVVPGGGEHNGEKGGHEQHVVSGEEYIVQGRDAGQKEADGKACDHEPRNLGAVVLLGNADDGFVGGHHTVRPGCPSDHGPERFERGGDQRGTSADQEKTECGFQRAADDGADGFA